ncbi:MAG TPA: T9SS type A sorting domain-containing protein [Bacteroidia bacterium]|nr:T9SS type A sorting domain-containing protein [Bacteroidia bacterium]
MKKTLLFFIFFLLFIFNAKGQNLVPNGDFEQYSGCPTAYSQIDSALFWFNPTVGWSLGGTPDYHNACSVSQNVGVPDNGFGYQYAHSGAGYAGAYCGNSYLYPNYREYIETSITTPLTANTCYHFEMYVSIGDRCRVTTDDLGIYFSNTQVIGTANWNPLPFVPQISNTTGFITDTIGWTLISGNYQAQGGESFLIIGNFKDSVNTTFNNFNFLGTDLNAYFYIDDVSLSPCTGIEEQNQNNAIKIYPNPVKESLSISYKLTGKEKAEIIIRDILGKEILRKPFSNSKMQISTSNFQSGIYFVEINDACLPDRQGKNIYRKKFLKL